MSSTAGRIVVHPWDDYVNFQLGPALLYVDAPLDLFPPPQSPQASLTGKFPHRETESDLRSHVDNGQQPMLGSRRGSRPRRSVGADVAQRSRQLRVQRSPMRAKLAATDADEGNQSGRERPSLRVIETSTDSAQGEGLSSLRREGTSSAMHLGRRLKDHASPSAPMPVPNKPPPTLQVTPVSPKPIRLTWEDLPSAPLLPTNPLSPTFSNDTFLGAPLSPDPTTRNRLARKSTLTLSLAGASRRRIRTWRSSPIAPLAVRLVTPTTTTPTTEPPMWEEDNDDPFAPVRERISSCQDRITEHSWVLTYGAAALAQNARPASTHATDISRAELPDASPRPGRSSFLAPTVPRRSRRFSFGWERERDTSGWKRESARASQRIEHFEHLQDHYLGLMAAEGDRMRTAQVRTYNWGWEREGLRSA